jgi:hypothetical protein
VLKQFADPLGKAFSMLPTSPPQVSQKEIINFLDGYATRKGSDIAWMELVTYQIGIISKGIRQTGGRDPWLLVQEHWWEMTIADLMIAHKAVLS